MREVSILQNTDEWKEMRKNYIGASEANIIMGVSLHMTRKQLFDQKLKKVKEKEEDENNFIQNKGHRIESKFRPSIELMCDSEFPPIVATSEEYDFLMASLDGYSSGLNINWECKYCGQEKFDFVKNENKCLPEYYPQVQQQLLLTGASHALFTVVTDDKEATSALPFKSYTIEVAPDFEYMQNELIPELKSFWDMLKNGEEPELVKGDVLDMSDNEQLLGLLTDYLQAKRLAEENAVAEKNLKTAIQKLCGHSKVICNGVTVTKITTAGKTTIDYKKYCEDSRFTLPASYTKIGKSSSSLRITFPKENK